MQYSFIKLLLSLGTAANGRKFAGSIPDGVIGIFHWLNRSGGTMALRSSQPLTTPNWYNEINVTISSVTLARNI